MDGTRTRDHSDHNRELYQLSYHRRREPLYAPAPVLASSAGLNFFRIFLPPQNAARRCRNALF